MKLAEALASVLAGETLSREAARAVFAEALVEGSDAIQLAGLLSALAMRGERPAEIAGAVDALREAMVSFEHELPDAIDTCGTGGDGLETFNLSTAAAVVVAACGVPVIKHGNRSLSSKCGSADLLEAAGIAIELSPRAAREVLEEVGITFLFAPRYHPALRFAGPVRRALGVRTIFNFLGPLVNPGRVKRQLLGVPEAKRLADLGNVLEEIGCERAYVVHGAQGADELTLAGGNRLRPVGPVPELAFDARDLGLSEAPVEALKGGDAQHNLLLFESILNAEPGPLTDAVLLNAAAALVVADRAASAAAALELARGAITSGAAREKLRAWCAASAAHEGAA